MKNKIAIENWAIRQGNKSVSVRKIAVRDEKGRFNGATNYRGSVLKSN